MLEAAEDGSALTWKNKRKRERRCRRALDNDQHTLVAAMEQSSCSDGSDDGWDRVMRGLSLMALSMTDSLGIMDLLLGMVRNP